MSLALRFRSGQQGLVWIEHGRHLHAQVQITRITSHIIRCGWFKRLIMNRCGGILLPSMSLFSFSVGGGGGVQIAGRSVVRLCAKNVCFKLAYERQNSNLWLAVLSTCTFGSCTLWTNFKDVLQLPYPECRSLLLDQTQGDRNAAFA
jgi:hypothetical protein